MQGGRVVAPARVAAAACNARGCRQLLALAQPPPTHLSSCALVASACPRRGPAPPPLGAANFATTSAAAVALAAAEALASTRFLKLDPLKGMWPPAPGDARAMSATVGVMSIISTRVLSTTPAWTPGPYVAASETAWRGGRLVRRAPEEGGVLSIVSTRVLTTTPAWTPGPWRCNTVARARACGLRGLRFSREGHTVCTDRPSRGLRERSLARNTV